MSRSGAALAVLTLVLVPAGFAADAESEVRELVLGFNAAYESNDLERYFAAYAEDATVQWWPEGRQSVADYRASWERTIASGAKVVTNRVHDLMVRLSPGGESAYATYEVEFAMESADGRRSEARALETDVLHRLGGRWRIVHVHYQTRDGS